MASSRRAISAVATALGAIVCMLLVAVAPSAMAVPHRSPAPFASVDRALKARVRSDELSGAATVVLGPGDVVLHRAAVGSVHAGTRLPIASASKWLTAAMVMVLVDHHRLSLDDRVETVLPEFQGDKATMTVRELLSHTSGLTAAECVGDPSGTLAECVTRLAKDSRLAAPPGHEFIYSNDDYHVIGRIIEVIMRTSFERAFEALIARPVGMSHTRFDRFAGVQTRNPVPAASAVSSVDDYRRFLKMIAAGGVVGSRRVLSAAAVAEIERDQVQGLDTRADPAVRITRIPTYGLGVWRDVTDASDQAVVVSGNGALGFYPWVDVIHHTYGIVAVDDKRGAELAVPESQKLARREWTIAARLATPQPAPSSSARSLAVGALVVGTRTDVWVDASRPLPANGAAPAAATRPMATTVWYPATGAPRPSATSGAPPDRTDGPYPLVVFAHGFAVTPATYTELLARWRRRGMWSSLRRSHCSTATRRVVQATPTTAGRTSPTSSSPSPRRSAARKRRVTCSPGSSIPAG